MTRSLRRFICRLAGIPHWMLACPLLLWICSASAGIGVTETEMQMVPRYCPDTQGFAGYGDAYSNTSPRARYWVSVMGPSFWHMHHYCTSLVLMNRALKAGQTRAQRIEFWKGALANYVYVTDRAEATFIMLPEIYTRIGDVLLLLLEPNKAEQAFSRARDLKPDYWPSYSHWAEYLMRTGHRPEALKVVTAGLQYAPNAKGLLEQYRTLGGKPEDLPKPIEKAPAQDEAPDEPATALPSAPATTKETRQDDN